MPLVATIAGLCGSIVAILSVVLGLVVRATAAYTRLRVEVHSAIEDLNKHIIDERAERSDLRVMTFARIDDMSATLSRVDRDVARLIGRRGSSGSA